MPLAPPFADGGRFCAASSRRGDALVGPPHAACCKSDGLREALVWWGIGFGGFFYLLILFTLGLMTLRNGHGWMFFFGIFLPFFWLIGAFLRPAVPRVA